MKNTRRIAAFVASVLAVALMAAPMTSFAATGGTNVITITAGSDDAGVHSNMAAYQVFAGTYNTTDNNLTVTGWGDGINVVAFITAIKADATIGSSFESVTAEDSAATAQAVADIIGKWTGSSAEASAFAKLAVANSNGTVSGVYTAASGDTKASITGLPDGYYVVADVEAAEEGDYSSYTLGLLQVAGGTTTDVTTKIDYPSVVKKVMEDDISTDGGYGAGYNDVADWDTNTDVPFKIIATLPSNVKDYSEYYLKFRDTQDDTFSAPENIVVAVSGNALTVEADYVVAITGNDFTITIDDIISAAAAHGVALTGGETVEVTYTAKLNATGDSTAVIGLDGQENVVDLTYSNNPNNAGDGSTDVSPEDKVIVFTYALDITKIDGATEAVLEGAEFKLKNKDGEYALVDEATGYFLGWDTEGTTLKSDANGKIEIYGLDDGSYTLEELDWSEDYNIPDTGFVAVIDATTEFTQASYDVASDVLTALTGTIDETVDSTANAENGTVSGTIKNNKGSILPSTGGIGTTIFVVGGGAMVAAAGILLVSKKRMSK